MNLSVLTIIYLIGSITFILGLKMLSHPETARKGNLIAGGLAGMQLSRVQFNQQGLESRREMMLSELRQRIRDVRQGADGLIYLTTDMPDGAILKLEPAPEP